MTSPLLAPRLSRAAGVLVVAAAVLVACSATPKAKEERICTPGAYVFCRCQDRQEGTKLCKDDAKSFGPCEPCESYDNPEIPLEPGDPRGPFDPDAGFERPQRDSGSTEPECGDGVVQEGEDCDDENADSTDGCDSKCKLSGIAPPKTNACPGLDVHVWGGTHRPTLASTTTGAGNRKTKEVCPSEAGNTPTSGAAGPDRVFHVFAHESGSMTVRVTDANFNVYLYAAETCPTDDVVWFTCANRVDGLGDAEEMSFPVESGKSYYVFVDGALASKPYAPPLQGTFRVTFSIQ